MVYHVIEHFALKPSIGDSLRVRLAPISPRVVAGNRSDTACYPHALAGLAFFAAPAAAGGVDDDGGDAAAVLCFLTAGACSTTGGTTGGD